MLKTVQLIISTIFFSSEVMPERLSLRWRSPKNYLAENVYVCNSDATKSYSASWVTNYILIERSEICLCFVGVKISKLYFNLKSRTHTFK